MKNILVLAVLLSLIACQASSPDINLTVLEGKTLDFADNTPLAGVKLELISNNSGYTGTPSLRYFTSDTNGNYKIEFEASPDSSYYVFYENLPHYFFSNAPYSTIGVHPISSFTRGATQTVNLMFCKAAELTVIYQNNNRLQLDSVASQVLYGYCDSNIGWYELFLDNNKLTVSMFPRIQFWKIPSGQKPVVIFKGWRGSQLVISRRDTLQMFNYRDTIKHELSF
jgi:hypothetical protein